jgi:hypothetical protein
MSWGDGCYQEKWVWAYGEPGLALTRGPGPLLPDPVRYPEAPCACGWPSLLNFPPSYWHIIRHGRVSARRFSQLLNTVGSSQQLLERAFISLVLMGRRQMVSSLGARVGSP